MRASFTFKSKDNRKIHLQHEKRPRTSCGGRIGIDMRATGYSALASGLGVV